MARLSYSIRYDRSATRHRRSPGPRQSTGLQGLRAGDAEQGSDAMVDLEVPDAPQVWIMPSEVVADACRRSHRAWHSTPKTRGTGPKVQTYLRRIYLCGRT